MTGNDELVAIGRAAKATGISERTLRYWIANGKLTATPGSRGRRVWLSEVRRLAELTGKTPATMNETPASTAGSAGSTAEAEATALSPAGDIAGSIEVDDERWRAFWQPYLDRERERDQKLIDQAEEIGQLKARIAALEGQQDSEATHDTNEPPRGRFSALRQWWPWGKV